MQKHLANILQAGLAAAELAEVLATLPCIPALEQLKAMRPAFKWSRAACKTAAEAGHLEVVQWLVNKGMIDATAAKQPAIAAARSGNWYILACLLQHFSDDQRWGGACWQGIAFAHIFSLPEQQALLKLQSLAALADLTGVVSSCHQDPSWFAAKAGYISSLQWI